MSAPMSNSPVWQRVRASEQRRAMHAHSLAALRAAREAQADAIDSAQDYAAQALAEWPNVPRMDRIVRNAPAHLQREIKGIVAASRAP